MKNLKNKKGITLIALIVTIIVMLILVAVTVNVVIKSDIMGSAKKAAKDWKVAEDSERQISKVEIEGTKYTSINQYVNSITATHLWTRERRI